MENPIDALFKIITEKDLWKGSKTFERNDFLAQEGQTNTNLYYVTEGSFRLFLSLESQEQNIRFAYKETFFGVLDTFLTDKPSKYNIQALKKSSVQYVSKQGFQKLIQSHSELRMHWETVLATIIEQQLEREVDLLLQSPLQRYQRVLKRSPRVFQEIPHKHIANYLRMTPETLSRLKKS